MNNKKLSTSLLTLVLFSLLGRGQVPKVYSNITEENGRISLTVGGKQLLQDPPVVSYTMNNFSSIVGSEKGLEFNFKAPALNGVMYYGFIPQGDSRYPQPVFVGRSASIKGGVATALISTMGDNLDMIDWMQTFRGTLGYRIVSQTGFIIYDGRVNFNAEKYVNTFDKYTVGAGGVKYPTPVEPFRVVASLTEGPILANLTDNSVVIQFKTSSSLKPMVRVGGKKFSGTKGFQHEIEITGLSPDKEYEYEIAYGEFKEEYSFRTAPAPGTRSKFTFSYASDSRSGNGGGERNLGGTNAFILKRIMALNHQYGVRFMQFTGDLITGYTTSPDAIRLEYANWKNAISPYARYIPVVVTMGNHEALLKSFTNSQSGVSYRIDNFPFDEVSSEAVFQQEFVNPLNGPDSEDGSKYDPDPSTIDFPSYKETVFHFTYDNIAMVVLNSNYWFTPDHEQVKQVGGNIHGYIMDNQMAWMKETLLALDNNENIDHVFVTVHTPFFPNGGHVKDDMWYSGDNNPRPVVAGKAVDKGIIERRDELLDIIVNQTQKTRALLTGDEHNYSRTQLNSKTKLNRGIGSKKFKLEREIWQINNGAAGAPYYAQEVTPWSKSVQGFTTQNALVLFHVAGDKIQVEVFNPDTLEKFDEFELN